MDGGSLGTIDIAEGSFDECCGDEAFGRCRPDIVCVIESRERNRGTEHHPLGQLALHVYVLFGAGRAAAMQFREIAMNPPWQSDRPALHLPFLSDDLNYAGKCLGSKVLGTGSSKRHRDIGKFDVAAAGNFYHHG